MRDSAGIPFGHFRLIKRLARGGMAEVFLARQGGVEGFDRTVAVKRILPHLVDSFDFVRMFLDEARLAARLSHPNIVHIYEFGKVDEHYFIAMEYVDGVHAGQIIKRGMEDRLPHALVARIGADACAGLNYAHRLQDETGRDLQIVHRDISPPNLMVSHDGVVKLVDFGIAKAVSQVEQTRPGVVKGKFAYMSPEQTTAKQLDGRSDVFSVALVLWELLAGRVALDRTDPVDAMRAIRDGKLPRIEDVRPDVPPTLAAALERALAVRKEERYTAAELGVALEEFVKASPELATGMQLAEWVRARFPRANATGQHPRLGAPAGQAAAGTAIATHGPGTMAATPGSSGTQHAATTAGTSATIAGLGGTLAGADAVMAGVGAMADGRAMGDGSAMAAGDGSIAGADAVMAGVGGVRGRPAYPHARRDGSPPPQGEGQGGGAMRAPSQPHGAGHGWRIVPGAGSDQAPRGDASRAHRPTGSHPDADALPFGDTTSFFHAAADAPPTQVMRHPTPSVTPAATPRIPSNAEPAEPTGLTTSALDVQLRPSRRSRLGRIAAAAVITLGVAAAATIVLRSGASQPAGAQTATDGAGGGPMVTALPDDDGPVAALLPTTDAPASPDAEPPPPAADDAAEPHDTPPEPSVEAADVAPASIEVITRPAGARVTIDDDRQLRTPAQLDDLEPGTHWLRIELAGHEPVERTVDLAAGERRTLELALTKAKKPASSKRATPAARTKPAPAAPGKLTVRTTPYSVVYLGSKKLGVTPFAGIDLPAGTHRLTFKNPDREPHTRTVTIRPNETTKLNLMLP